MIDKLISIIQDEDKKNPFTDEQISKMLGISREKVNELRQQSNIPSYLERRDEVLLKAINSIVSVDKDISYRKLCVKLNNQGFKISTFGLNKYRDYIENIKGNMTNHNKKTKKYINKKANGCFNNIIGNNGSLNHVIKLAEAAVMYPKNGLHTLIVGNTGVGKSQLVEQMNFFARKIRKKDIPFVVFNCADYGDNPQLLVSQLFGYKKGSFTGADSDKEGLIEKADGGMLFLDEIHRLPPKGQEILFRVIDKGEFNRLGETDVIRKVNVMIIGATTENIESNLLNTFRRRIPVLVEIPNLEERPVIERMQLINKFFRLEAQRINKEMLVSGEIIRSLLFYRCPGNIGQLKSDIQVICARSFLNFIANNYDKVNVLIDDLPSHIKKQISYIYEKSIDFNMVNIKDMNICDDDNIIDDDENSIFKYNIYDFIEKRIEELKSDGKSMEDVRNILSEDLEEKVGNYANDIVNRYSGMSKQLLEDIVGKETIDIVDDIKKVLLPEMENFDSSIYNVLCLHISSAIERLRTGKNIVNPRLHTIKVKYGREFKMALKVIKMINMKLKMNFPEDEAGFIALYLNKFLNKEEGTSESKVGVIVVTHGEVSKAMLEISRSIIGIEHGEAITMSLDEKPEDVYIEARNMVKRINTGKGVLLLVDMGSLITFGDIITKELGIPTRIISRVDTLMVLEALRKSVQSTATLDSVFNSLLDLEKILPRSFRNNNVTDVNIKEKVIITTCVTGIGTAIKIKEMILHKLKEIGCQDLEIIPLGLIEENGSLLEKIKNIRVRKEVIAVVGTVNPEIPDIFFVSLEEFLKGEKMELFINLINNKKAPANSEIRLKDMFHASIVRVFHSMSSKEEIISIMTRLMEKAGFVSRDFYENILDREDLGSSCIGDGVAIPHGSYDKSIINPAIGVAIIKNPMEWDEENNVSVLFILALTTAHKKLFLELYKVIKNSDLIVKIRDMDDRKLITNTILEYIKQNYIIQSM
ncbi:MAG: sigma 54-interacting transcriptional regulator [Clostridium sp.]|jgi:transcriptional regulator with AAA-type ATPase domain/transcriptional regulatory protein LevR|uniref:sigma 54-interacting transcriptional regulator n=1 Tax=Clostridium sp. TaxID=1506 RepID=UPI0025C3FCFF|nr:sigma 54-interacting transcriptional regulator [Clostridium sp.]MCH3963123.1 sigma 54-interacting transcriptional regulator [Clostridium sp.]MCI1716414.1 sigma 54-interacting transcriptional regulator [Clostridium sp.]MCI1800754.1 sigma 54-interacting transcriptional regulator [Clostridium sp.]MCI1814591.1 sigma 54-interacting transcriptional regulator [Clostridium sp.]MCI1871501.1 sigma 54-interacting transcriptional regulator [Clostridium sp.]